MRTIFIVAAVTLSACAHFWTPAPDVRQPLPATDKRHAITGDWALTLTVDSIGGRWSTGALRDSLPQVRVACFRIADSLASARRSFLRATLQPSFGRMLGFLSRTPAPMPPEADPPPSSEEARAAKQRAVESPTWPLAWGGHAIDVQRRKDRWHLILTPGVSDDYVGLAGELSGGSLAGTWLHSSQGQMVAMGHFTMHPVGSSAAQTDSRLQQPGRTSAATPCSTGVSQAENES